MKLCDFEVGLDKPFFLIAGPCVIESQDSILRIAETMKGITDKLGIPYLFKASYDKANRSSINSYRGPGIEEGLRMLDRVRSEVGVPILTDVHSPEEVKLAAEVADMLQTPAFLCRQTDLITAVADCGKPANIKKAQFMAPEDMVQVINKAKESGSADGLTVCERGSSFGYRNLVVDMRSLAIMRETGRPVVFDATHSVQLPGGLGSKSGGQREFVPVLARAAVAVGVSGLFMETHPDPANALSDGANAWPLGQIEELLKPLIDIDRTTKANGFLEQTYSEPD